VCVVDFRRSSRVTEGDKVKVLRVANFIRLIIIYLTMMNQYYRGELILKCIVVVMVPRWVNISATLALNLGGFLGFRDHRWPGTAKWKQ